MEKNSSFKQGKNIVLSLLFVVLYFSCASQKLTNRSTSGPPKIFALLIDKDKLDATLIILSHFALIIYTIAEEPTLKNNTPLIIVTIRYDNAVQLNSALKAISNKGSK